MTGVENRYWTRAGGRSSLKKMASRLTRASSTPPGSPGRRLGDQARPGPLLPRLVGARALLYDDGRGRDQRGLCAVPGRGADPPRPPALQQRQAQGRRPGAARLLQRAAEPRLRGSARHTRLRRLVQPAFSPRLVEGLLPGIEAKIDELLARAEASRPGVEFMSVRRRGAVPGALRLRHRILTLLT